MTCAFTHALIRPSPGGTPWQNRSMSAPQALAITICSCAFAADAASTSTTPSARPVTFAIIASPRSSDGPPAATRGGRRAEDCGSSRTARLPAADGPGRASRPVAGDPARSPVVVGPVARDPDRLGDRLLFVAAGLPGPTPVLPLPVAGLPDDLLARAGRDHLGLLQRRRTGRVVHVVEDDHLVRLGRRRADRQHQRGAERHAHYLHHLCLSSLLAARGASSYGRRPRRPWPRLCPTCGWSPRSRPPGCSAGHSGCLASPS